MKRFKIYIELDAIIDTRLPVLQKILPIYSELDMLKEYITRNDDNFKYIGNTLFKHLYKTRGRDTLLSGYGTNMPLFIKTLLAGMKIARDANEDYSDNLITINTYPYDLIYEEKVKIVKEYETFIGVDALVKVIYKPFTEEMLQDHDYLFIYDGIDKLATIHSEAYRNGFYSNTSLYCCGSVFDSKNFDDIDKLIENYTKSMEPFIDLNLLPPALFSLGIEDKEKRDATSTAI